MKAPVAFLLFLTAVCSALESENLVILVLSQPIKYHINLAEELKQDILKQSQQLQQKSPKVILSHETFEHVGDWTVLPIIPELSSLLPYNTSWVIICSDKTRFTLYNLLEILNTYDHTKDLWLGYGLYDREPTIIHHFQMPEYTEHFLYPNLASGFAFSITYFKKLEEHVKQSLNTFMDFSIDAYYELASFIWDKGKGIRLTHVPRFCVFDSPECASYIKQNSPCNNTLQPNSIFVAVKTCLKFHTDRLPAIKKTWAKYFKNIIYYSDFNDMSIPSMNLGVPNTEHGHCGKTLAILMHVSKVMEKNDHLKWLIIVDDDTILSPSRLEKFLECFDPREVTALGERYGYRVSEEHGYNYITGGGGMVFSSPLVHYLTLPEICECPSNSSPDDMYLGICLARSELNITHSPMFHQARPNDYSPEYLASHQPITFHKHWMVDPIKVYNDWFGEEDRQYFSPKKNTKTEL